MRYLSPVEYADFRSRYDLLIGWGTSEIEFMKRYDALHVKMDYLIDGLGKNKGHYICNIEVMDADILKDLKGKKICFIIFTNIEETIIKQIAGYLDDFDTIVYRLIKYPSAVSTYSRDREDLLLMDLLKVIAPTNVTYLDIGVCHPVVRNNTYGLYERGYYNGVLVEPNHAMCALIEQYRPHNKLLMYGACAGDDRVLRYYESENVPGRNSFSDDRASSERNVVELPLRNINAIIRENFKDYPTVLDIDTEGMDIELLTDLDTDRYKIPIICAESLNHSGELRVLLQQRGYVHIISTLENEIYVRKGMI